jgi:hypothetical protein
MDAEYGIPVVILTIIIFLWCYIAAVKSRGYEK